MENTKWKKILKLGMVILGVIVIPNMYHITGKLGVGVTPEWYKEFVKCVSEGGNAAIVVAAAAGATLPGWVILLAAACGVNAA